MSHLFLPDGQSGSHSLCEQVQFLLVEGASAPLRKDFSVGLETRPPSLGGLCSSGLCSRVIESLGRRTLPLQDLILKWSLYLEGFRFMCDTWGTLEVNLFASKQTHLLLLFLTQSSRILAGGLDALAVGWMASYLSLSFPDGEDPAQGGASPLSVPRPGSPHCPNVESSAVVKFSSLTVAKSLFLSHGCLVQRNLGPLEHPLNLHAWSF